MGAEDLDAHDIAAYDPEAFAALLSDKPAVHRYPGSMAGRVQQRCAGTSSRPHDGEAEAVWRGVSTGKELLKRLQEPARLRQAEGPDLPRPARQAARRPAGGLALGRRRLRRTRRLPPVADITGPESLTKVRAHKQEMKAAAKAAKTSDK